MFVSRSRVIRVVTLLCCCSIWAAASIASDKDDATTKPKKPRFEQTGQLIKDNRTGLLWPANGNLSAESYSWNGAFEYISVLNKERFAGSGEWRLPTKEEFQGLIEYAKSMGYDGSGPDKSIAAGLRTSGFSNIRDAEYWSSTTNMYNAAEAWFISLVNGAAGTGSKDLYLPVWPVRSGH